MKPQSKVTIFMVVMIVMLSIYYFTLGGDDNKNPGAGGPGNREVYRYEVYEDMREQSAEARAELIAELQATMVSADETDAEKNSAFSYIVELQKMTSTEYVVETALRNEGYLDALVQSSNTSAAEPTITVRILDSEHSASEANEIIRLVKTEFLASLSTEYDVTVRFDTPKADEMY